MGAFDTSTLWRTTRTWEPNFGPVPGALSADWQMIAPTETPRDITCWSATEAHVPWSYPHFGGEQNANWYEDTHAFTLPQSAYTGWRFSCDVRFSAQTIPPRAEGNAASNMMLIRSSTGANLEYLQILQTLHALGDTWEFSSSAGGAITLGSLTKNRYYRIGLRKLGTRLTAWFNPNADTGASPAPHGAAGDAGLVQMHEEVILPTYATDLYIGFYSSSNYVSFDPLSGAYDRGGIACPRVEEVTLVMGGETIPGLPSSPINLPPGAPQGLPGGWGGGYPPGASPALTMRHLAEAAAYHRYKNTRTAMAIYNNLRLDA